MTNLSDKMTAIEMCLEILENTNDGGKLSPQHLKLIEMSVNGFANDEGLAELERIYQLVKSNQYVDWFHGIEHLTKDHEGYVYWKGQHVEHYSFRNYEEEEIAAQDLKECCIHLEKLGVPVNCTNAVWEWEKYKDCVPTI